MTIPGRGVTQREANRWVELAMTILLYGVFFIGTASGMVKGAQQIGLLIGVVIAQIAMHIAYAIAMAIFCGEEEADERDALIAMRSYRVGYFVLMFSVSTVTLCYVAWGGVTSLPEAAAAGLRGPSVSLVGNALLLCFLLAEASRSIAQIIMYRRGA